MANAVERDTRPQSRREGDAALVESLHRQLLAALRPVFAGAVAADLIDYPDHYNVGDAVLWLGERAILRELGVRTRSAATRATYRAERLRADGPLVITRGRQLRRPVPDPSPAAHGGTRGVSGPPFDSAAPIVALRRRTAARGVAPGGRRPRQDDPGVPRPSVLRDRQARLRLRGDTCPRHGVALGALRRRPPERAVVAQMRTDKESAVTAIQAGTWIG